MLGEFEYSKTRRFDERKYFRHKVQHKNEVQQKIIRTSSVSIASNEKSSPLANVILITFPFFRTRITNCCRFNNTTFKKKNTQHITQRYSLGRHVCPFEEEN